MRRLIAIVVAAAFGTSSVAFAASMDCPTATRARMQSRCCCPAGAQENARVSCCNDLRESRVVTSTPRVQAERPHLAPCLTVVALVPPDVGLRASAWSLTRRLPASTAGPPPVPLRI